MYETRRRHSRKYDSVYFVFGFIGKDNRFGGAARNLNALFNSDLSLVNQIRYSYVEP